MVGRRSEVQILRRLLIAIAAIVFAALPAAAADLLILQSRHHLIYDQAVRLLQNNCNIKSETLVVSDYAEFDLGRIVREEQPRVVLAIGEQAFAEARKLRRTPVVYSLTLNVHDQELGKNIAGISMHIAPDNYIKLFNKLQLRRVGIIYDPDHSGTWLKRARKAAADSGTELIAQEVRSPREVAAALLRLAERSVDALWMIPDSSAVAPESINAYFLFAQQQNLPVISFSRGYLAKGAIAVLEGSPADAMAQSCSMVKRLWNGATPGELSTVDINRAALYINENVAERLHLNLSGLRQLFPPHNQ
jgi:ABC-type uncharacterized transport system substrate-binding protein